MKTLYLDLEVKDTKRGKRRDPSPYLPHNFIVSFGFRTKGFPTDTSGYHFLRHAEFTGDANAACVLLQNLLDEAEELVAFNAKFELAWLLEAGFKYDGAIRCPMVTEYILARGTKINLGLDECCKRAGTTQKLGNLVEGFWADGLGFDNIPKGTVEEYGIRDVDCLYELDEAQSRRLSDKNSHLTATIKMSHEFIRCLVEMERNGIFIDADAVEDVRAEYQKEYDKLRAELEEIAQSVMGDTKINLDSPEQLSWLIYSRKVNDKHEWAKIFNIGTDARGKRTRPPRMSTAEFVGAIKQGTTILKCTSAIHCGACSGTGRLHNLLTKSGRAFKNPPKCSGCVGRGILYQDTGIVAGFRLIPRGPQDTAAGGFATDKDTLSELAKRIERDDKERQSNTRERPKKLQLSAKRFLEAFIRYNAIGTYLDTFIKGIADNRLDTGLLHTQLMQCVTATGRLSSIRPNFQNMPRANTFPVRRVVRSRWEGGLILEVDFAQLEFRIAAFLAQDKRAIEDILNKVDVHAYTASIIGCSRQDAKPHTFKPLYGGSSGTEAEQRYYKAFKAKYPQITEWQNRNIQQVLKAGSLVIPSGREYNFPGTRRTPSGYVVNTTQIYNYPVQGFATADVVPVTILEVYDVLRKFGLRSKLILTVHDSIVFDVYPGEQQQIIGIINTCFSRLPDILNHRYGINVNIPLDWDIKCGPNWLELKGVH